jgi:hypothetical protein
MTLQESLEKARELDARVVEIAIERGAKTLQPPLVWYGLDPIHIRKACIRQAWNAIFNHWSNASPSAMRRLSLPRKIYLRTRSPDRVRILGKQLRGVQPCLRFDDGTTIAMY